MRDSMLYIHFLGLILGLGSGFASLFLGVANKDLSREDAPKFMFRLRSLGYMGITGLVLLIVSGGYLATPYWKSIGAMPLFMAKLSLVIVLLVIIIIMDNRWRKALQHNDARYLKLIPKLGRVALPLGLLILLFAVLQFH